MARVGSGAGSEQDWGRIRAGSGQSHCTILGSLWALAAVLAAPVYFVWVSRHRVNLPPWPNRRPQAELNQSHRQLLPVVHGPADANPRRYGRPRRCLCQHACFAAAVSAGCFPA